MNLTRGPGEKPFNMMKKLSYLAAAFVMGVLLSVTINACGGDTERVEPGGTQNPSGGNGEGNEGGDTGEDGRKISNWEIYKLSASEDYDENGQVTRRYEYKYNDKGWEIQRTYTFYNTSPTTGKRYLFSQTIYTYAYSSAGDYRTTNSTMTYYNEDGSVQSTTRSTGKEYVYQQ